MDSDRLRQLSDFHSKVTEVQMRGLYSRFDVPWGYKLTAPAASATICSQGNGQSPLYIQHMECGLRLPLHPFLHRVFDALGVSPIQMTPNSIGLLVCFVVICTWLGVRPSLNVLGHFVGVTITKAPHYHLQAIQASGDFKIVLDVPTSYKGWKERFVWVSGDDFKLSCPTWPEIRRDMLKAIPLSPSERVDLARIKQYAGSREMSNLFDPARLGWRVFLTPPRPRRTERGQKSWLK